MPIPIVNSIASWFLKKRFHQIDLFLKYPIEVQHELLLNLLYKAKYTEIGKKYHFSSIANYREFADRVPITTYEEIEAQIERSRLGENNIFWPTQIKWFAKSSGTTSSKSKFIPVTKDALEDCHYRGGKDVLAIYTEVAGTWFVFEDFLLLGNLGVHFCRHGLKFISQDLMIYIIRCNRIHRGTEDQEHK